MNEEDLKLRKLFFLIKEVVERISGIGERYKSKYIKAKASINWLETMHQKHLAREVTDSNPKSNKPPSESKPIDKFSSF